MLNCWNLWLIKLKVSHIQFNCKHRCTLYSIHLLPSLRCPRSRLVDGGLHIAARVLELVPRTSAQCRLLTWRTLATPCLVPSACWLLADRSAQGEVTICLAQCWQWQQTAVARSPRNKWLRPGVGSLGPGGTLVHTLYTLCTVFVHSPVRSSNHRHFKTQENCRKLCSSPGSFAFKYPPSSFFDFDWSVAQWVA